ENALGQVLIRQRAVQLQAAPGSAQVPGTHLSCMGLQTRPSAHKRLRAQLSPSVAGSAQTCWSLQLSGATQPFGPPSTRQASPAFSCSALQRPLSQYSPGLHNAVSSSQCAPASPSLTFVQV